jgi:hypothetical protein
MFTDDSRFDYIMRQDHFSGLSRVSLSTRQKLIYLIRDFGQNTKVNIEYNCVLL